MDLRLNHIIMNHTEVVIYLMLLIGITVLFIYISMVVAVTGILNIELDHKVEHHTLIMHIVMMMPKEDYLSAHM